jgi:hypothetical protein
MERICGKCTLCCRILGIEAIGKAAGEWCRHCDIGRGCNIHDERPQSCRDFDCLYKTDPALPEAWSPVLSHLLLRMDHGGGRLMVFVDPVYPDAWTRAPYHRQLRHMAAGLLPRHGQVMVRIDDRHIAVLPERDVDLGICQGKFTINYTPRFTLQGARWDVTVVRPDA